MDSQTPHLSLGFRLTSEIHTEINNLLARIEQNSAQPGLSADAATVLSKLLSLAIDQFYFDIMDQVQAHPAARRSADKGISTVIKGAKLVIRKMVNSLEPHELDIFANYIGTLILEEDNQHYMAFPLDNGVSDQTEQVILRIRNDSNTNTYNHLIVEALCGMTDQAVVHFYNKPTRLFKVRPFIRKSADLGIKTVNKGIHFVIKQLMKKTRQKELITFSHILERQLVTTPTV
ncbi:MAG: hypothetical protein KUG73_16210 [Pseudomonadales bacterium]|nr:hypothetical protein [Pseudomonadales bacterium]